MDRYLNILIVEDSEDDCSLLVRNLERGGLEVHYRRVDTKPELLEALEETSWAVVITDHVMPSLSSGDVIEVVRETKSDIPVIIVSGSIGEEVAVVAMKAGASDYIMKDNLKRLAPAIEREIKEAKNRKARRRAEDQIKHMAYHDVLTGLANRFQFELALKDLLHSARQQNESHAFLYLDLDQFKIVNDTCGHIAGDELLRQLSLVLKKHVRNKDTLARLGGDEFGILLEYCPLNRAQQIAGELLSEINEFRFSWKGRSFALGASIGLVSISRFSKDVSQIMSQADLACYTAKDLGRNRVYVYLEDDGYLSRQVGDMNWVNRINNALDEDRFIIYQQSIVSLQKGKRLFYREFLIRMLDDSGDIILPGAFIPAAERYNIMPELDRYIINHIFTHLAKQQAHSNGDMAFINLSGVSISDPDLSIYIREKIEEYGIDPKVICFEITETAAIIDLDRASKFISQVKDLGCYFALDDFGSGMSSFSYLNILPVDFIKIDGEFVKDMDENPMNAAIVESINKIGHVAGLKIIGEYAETDAIINQLRLIGVDFAQGYGFGIPAPVE